MKISTQFNEHRLQQKALLARNEHAAKRLRESEGTSEEKTARDANLWSSEESFQMLSNELFSLKTSRTCPFQVDAVENDAHIWDVRLSQFSGPLREDAHQLSLAHGYGYVELRLHFKEDLHPFYPPKVEVRRERSVKINLKIKKLF